MSVSNRFAVAFSVATRSAIRSNQRLLQQLPKNNPFWLVTPSSNQCSAAWLHHSSRPQRKVQPYQRRRPQALASAVSSDDYLDDDDDVDDNDSDLSNYRPSFSMPPNSQDDSSTVGTTSSSVKRSRADTQKDSFLQWSSLGLWTELVTAVTEDLELQAPTAVQRLAVPSLLREPPQHTAFLAATGSGKTLAYLLPLLQQLKNQEVFGNNSTSASSTSGDATQLLLQQQSQQQQSQQRPKLIILAPTRELVQQITQVVKKLCHSLKLSSQVLSGGSSLGQERQRLQRHLDVVVATPGRLLQHWKAHHVFLGQVQHVVLDEMDTMLEQGFQGEIRELLYPLLYQSNENSENAAPSKQQPSEQLKLKPNAPRLVLTSATMTQAVQKLLGVNTKGQDQVGAKKHYVKDPTQPKPTIVLPQPMQVITAPGLHKAVPRLEQVFINVNNVDKLSLLVDIVSRSHDPKRRLKKEGKDGDEEEPYLTLVFCNTVASCRAAQHALSEAGIESLNYHGELNSDMRSDNLQVFSQGQCRVLVATDLAARGLDVPQIQHVVMFDFPLNPLDYLHRTGRTARGNRTGGKVTALVAKRDQVLAKAIEQAVLRGLPLDGLTSRKSDYNQAGGRLLVLKSSGVGTSGSPRRASTFKKTTTDPTARLRASSRGTGAAKSETSSRRGRSKSTVPTSSSSRRGSATASNQRDGVARKRSKST